MSENKIASTIATLAKSTNVIGKKIRKLDIGYLPHFVIGIVVLILIVVMFPRGKSYQFADLKEGEVYIGEQVVAPFTFSVNKTADEYNRDVTLAKRSVPPVFVRVDSIVKEQTLALSTVLRSTEEILNSISLDSVKLGKLKELLSRNKIVTSDEVVSHLVSDFVPTKSRSAKEHGEQNAPPDFKAFVQILGKITRDVYTIGILNIAPKDLPNNPEKIAITEGNDEIVEQISNYHNAESIGPVILQKLRENIRSENEVKIGYQILTAIVNPNIYYNETETSERIKEAAARVPLAKGTVLEKERIIDSHEKITKEHIQKLQSLAAAKAEREASSSGTVSLFFPVLGKIIMVAVALSFLTIFLFLARKKIFQDFRKLLMIAISLLLVLFLAHLVGRFSLSEYLIPVAITSMLLTIFFDTQVAFMGTVTLAVSLGGLRGNEFAISLVTFVVGAVGILSVRKVRSRSWLFKSILWLTAGYAISISTLELLRYSSFEEVSKSLFYGVINGFLSPILTYGLMVIFEYLFDMTTDATLLELSDLNKPLLRQLAMRASGTYHHSLLVGSLAEAAAESIGANSLLTRVGAYYHDIGKMEKPEYFVENQKGGKNPHEKLSPSMSYLILVSHVKRGLEIAQEYGLPKEIQAFISEHHGTSLVAYFYKKALDKNDGTEVIETDFRYPGPKPQSKETGIVMLADSVEATSRSLKDPSVSRLRSMVSSTIDDRFKNCELDESPLTLRDLNKIQEAFLQILTGIFHGRIEYPDQDKLFANEEEPVDAKSETKLKVPTNGDELQPQPHQEN